MTKTVDRRTFGDSPEPEEPQVVDDAPPSPALDEDDMPPGEDVEPLPDALQEIQDIVDQAERQAEEGLVQSACDMLNRFLLVDPDWATAAIVRAQLPVSQKIVDAARTGDVPLHLTPLKDGRVVTSMLGMINAFLKQCGCKGKVAANLAVSKQGEIQGIRHFAPWEGAKNEPDENKESN